MKNGMLSFIPKLSLYILPDYFAKRGLSFSNKILDKANEVFFPMDKRSPHGLDEQFIWIPLDASK